MMFGYGFTWVSMMLTMLGSTLWMVVLVVLAWAVIRWLNTRTPRPTWQTPSRLGSDPTAREFLSQRYARGEIDATTFEQMQERLAAADNAHRQGGADGRRPVGESLFDGRTRGENIW